MTIKVDNSEKAQDNLESIKKSKQATVNQFHVPWWHDPLLGLLLALIVIHHSMPMPWNLLIVSAGVFGLYLFVRRYTRQQIWVDGWRKGRTLWVTISYCVSYILIYAGSITYYHPSERFWILPVSALIIFGLTIIFGRIWTAVWRWEVSDV